MVQSMMHHSSSLKLKKIKTDAGITPITASAQFSVNYPVLSVETEEGHEAAHSLELIKARQIFYYAKSASAVDKMETLVGKTRLKHIGDRRSNSLVSIRGQSGIVVNPEFFCLTNSRADDHEASDSFAKYHA